MRYLLAVLTLSTASWLHAQQGPEGLVVLESTDDVPTTADRLSATLEEKGLTEFARIDHAENAVGADLSLRPTTVVIFGNPNVGTPFMQCAQSVAIDLPQKMLIWENESGVTSVAYNAPEYLASRHGASDCGDVVEKIAGALDGVARAAAGQ